MKPARTGRRSDRRSWRSFAELLSIPNDAGLPGGIDRNAIWIRDELMRRGARAAVTQIPGAAPLVFGRIDGDPGGPTIGFYAHFDGQPVDDLAWTEPPFSPTLRDGRVEDGASVIPWPTGGGTVDPEWRVYARGSADDRGAVAALLGALDARMGRDPARLDRVPARRGGGAGFAPPRRVLQSARRSAWAPTSG